MGLEEKDKMGHYKYDWSDLKELYVNKKLSSHKIAEIKGCNHMSVLKQMKKQNIPRRTKSEAFNPITLKNLKTGLGKGMPKTKFILDCEWCGNEIERLPSKLKGYNHYFCSRHCKSKWIGNKLANDENYKQLMSKITLKNGNIPPLQKGENHYNWKGGITQENSLIRASRVYKNWRIQVFRNDDFICQICGERGHNLNAHHIYPMNKYPDDYLDEQNGITLCVPCHDYVHSIFGDV